MNALTVLAIGCVCTSIAVLMLIGLLFSIHRRLKRVESTIGTGRP